jgi:hypothetical protein
VLYYRKQDANQNGNGVYTIFKGTMAIKNSIDTPSRIKIKKYRYIALPINTGT